MAEAGIRDLRDHLSRYLERVRAGEELTVTDRGRPIARLVPVDVPPTFDRLVAEGLITPAGTRSRGLYDQLDLLEVDELLVRRAGELAQHDALRGYAAIHLAAAERVRHDTSVMVAGDHELCAAAKALGIAVASTSPEGLGDKRIRP